MENNICVKDLIERIEALTIENEKLKEELSQLKPVSNNKKPRVSAQDRIKDIMAQYKK